MSAQHSHNTSLSYISIFSGIEAASVAWEPLGFRPLAFAEVDPFPSAVLKARFPHVPNLGDVTKVDWSEFHGKADIIVGGSPCQAFSIAGKRGGLADERGKLMLEYVRCVREVQPTYCIWENVPGALSQDGGRAFATLLEELEECGYALAWRVLDAQFAGVAQRRRRVFLIGVSEDRVPLGRSAIERAGEILFEPDCLRGDHPSSKQKREELARAARKGTAPASGTACISGNVIGRKGKNGGNQVGFNEEDLSYTLTTNDIPGVCASAGSLNPRDNQPSPSEAVCLQGSMIGRADENGPQGNGLNEEIAFTLNATDKHAVAYALRNRSACSGKEEMLFVHESARDALPESNQDGVSGFKGGVVLDPGTSCGGFIYNGSECARSIGYEEEQSPTLMAEGKPPAVHTLDKAYTVVVRCGCEGGGKGALVAEDISMTLSTHNTQTLFQPAEQVVCLADDNAKAACDINLTGALKVGGSAPIVSKQEPVYCRASGMANAEQMQNCCPTMTARQYKDPPILYPGGSAEDTPSTRMVVRRLTPVECERLQGFPDNWTRIPWRGKGEEDCPDSPRYKAIGNSMAVPVMRWIGERIAFVEQS